VQERAKNVVKDVLQAIANNIEDYNNTLLSESASISREILKHIYKLYTNQYSMNDIDSRLFGKLFNQMIGHVQQKTGLHRESVMMALFDVVHEQENEMYKDVCRAFEEYILGTQRFFNHLFGIQGKDNIRFWISAGITHGLPSGQKELRFMLQDWDRGIATYAKRTEKSLHKSIPGAYLNSTGYIMCALTDDTMAQLANHICNVFGYGLFMSNLSIIPKVDFYRTIDGFTGALEHFEGYDFYQKIVSTLQSTSMKEIVTIDFW
jgi:hypothetical protein